MDENWDKMSNAPKLDSFSGSGTLRGESGAVVSKDVGNKPDYNVRAKGVEGYVGSGWFNKDGKFGPYISVKLSKACPEGSTLFLYPRK